MQGQYANDFITGKRKAHMRVRKDGVTEVRCMIKGVSVCGCSLDGKEAMRKFLDAVERLDTDAEREKKDNARRAWKENATVPEYFLWWQKNVVRQSVKDNTYKQYTGYYNNYISKGFKGTHMKDVRSSDVQEFVNGMTGSVAKTVCVALKSMFRYAVSDGVIDKSPAEAVKTPVYECGRSEPLTRAEEKALVERFKADKDNVYLQAYVFMLYTGLRRSELASVEYDGKGFTVLCAKTKKGHKDKTRWIPLCPMLARLLPLMDLDKVKTVNADTLTDYAREMLGGHHTHELRHTFITRAQECGVRREYVSLWSGHAADSSVTSQVYTHLEQDKELQAKAMQAFDYEL